MMTPMPKTVRSRGPSDLLSLNSGSSVSLMDCSMDLVRMIPTAALLYASPVTRILAHCRRLREGTLTRTGRAPLLGCWGGAGVRLALALDRRGGAGGILFGDGLRLGGGAGGGLPPTRGRGRAGWSFAPAAGDKVPAIGDALALPDGVDYAPAPTAKVDAPAGKRGVRARIVEAGHVHPWGCAVGTIGPDSAREAVADKLLHAPDGDQADHQRHDGGDEGLYQDGAPRGRRQPPEPLYGGPHAAGEVVPEIRASRGVGLRRGGLRFRCRAARARIPAPLEGRRAAANPASGVLYVGLENGGAAGDDHGRQGRAEQRPRYPEARRDESRPRGREAGGHDLVAVHPGICALGAHGNCF